MKEYINNKKQEEFDPNFEVKSENTQQKVMDVIKESIGDEEIANNQYPNIVDRLKDFLSENGFDFDDNDFLIVENNQSIDDDGYPYLKQSIIIIPINLVVTMTTFHHREWDFYIDAVEIYKECL